MKRKQGDASLEMTEQIDVLQKMKARIDNKDFVYNVLCRQSKHCRQSSYC